MSLLFDLARPVLMGIDPELAHGATIKALQFLPQARPDSDDPRLGRWRHQVVGRERQSAASAFAEPQLVHVVEQFDRRTTTDQLIRVADHLGQFAIPHRNVVERHALGEHVVEHHTTDGCLDDRAGLGVIGLGLQFAVSRQADLDRGMRIDLAHRMRVQDFTRRLEFKRDLYFSRGEWIWFNLLELVRRLSGPHPK